MKYSGIIHNDIIATSGLSLTLFVQGCPHHCFGCHNPDTWSFDGGIEFTIDTLDEIIENLNAQGIRRNFCLMGGEPLCEENVFLSNLVISTIKEELPDTPIYVWTGYTLEELQKRNNPKVDNILNTIDYLIDGPYKAEERDITLEMRGSRNQKIYCLKENRSGDEKSSIFKNP